MSIKKTKSLFEDEETISKILELVSKSIEPVTIDYIAKETELTWSTSRALLLMLSTEGKIHGQKTKNSWIFSTWF